MKSLELVADNIRFYNVIAKYFILLSVIFYCHPLLASQNFLLVATDEKITWSKSGETLIKADKGRDLISIFEISSNPKYPRLIKSFPLTNSILGSPNNIVITPDNKLALISNRLDWEYKNGKWGSVTDNKVYLIDLEGYPTHLDTLELESEPADMAVSPEGKGVLITYHKTAKISLLGIKKKTAKLIKTININAPASSITVTPDGKRIFFTMESKNKVGVIELGANDFIYDPKNDIPVGNAPGNISITPDGELALVANMGETAGNDGNIDTISVIDISTKQPHTIDIIPVGDGPIGLAISPNGKLAVTTLTQGSQNAATNPKTAWASHKNGAIAIMRINGKKVTKIDQLEVGGMPRGVKFSMDGKYLYVGNFLDNNLSVFKIEESDLVTLIHNFKLNGAPASLGTK